MVWSIHTVYLPRENLRFLEEWLAYHTALGADHFYLYDNTGSTDLHLDHAVAVTGRNKHGLEMDFTLSDGDILDIEAQILRRYPVTKVTWQPRENWQDHPFGHVASADHLAATAALDWCAFIDIDEFLNPLYPMADLLEGKAVTMRQKKFADRLTTTAPSISPGRSRSARSTRRGKCIINMKHYIPGGPNIHNLNVHLMDIGP